MKISKKNWIKAYKETLRQYETDTHDNTTYHCSKCILVNINKNSCINCPEDVFKKLRLYGCLERNNPAVSSNDIRLSTKKKIIEYHKKAINYLENMKRYSKKDFSLYLKKIDNEI